MGGHRDKSVQLKSNTIENLKNMAEENNMNGFNNNTYTYISSSLDMLDENNNVFYCRPADHMAIVFIKNK